MSVLHRFFFLYINFGNLAEKEVPKDVILVPDDDDNDDDKLGTTGPQNLDEARAYKDCLNKTLEDFAGLLNEDRKDALKITSRPGNA